MDSVYRNSEGYYDPTAGEALSRMGGAKMQRVEAGEIWEVEPKYGPNFEMLVIKPSQNYATGLRLTDEPTENCVSIEAMAIKYSDVGRPIYTYNDMFVRFVKALKPNEFARVKREMAETLDLITDEPTQDKPVGFTQDDIDRAVAAAKKEWDNSVKPLPIPEKSLDEAIEIAQYKTKAEVFEKLYRELLTKVTA